MGKSCRLGLVLLAFCACGDEAPKPRQKPATEKKAVDRNAWKEIETPVPVGKKLGCATILPLAELESKMGRKIELIDESARDPDATAVCRLLPVDKKGKPGDEICRVTVGCWSQWSVAEIKKKCDARGDQTSTDIGAFTCVQTLPAGDKERHVVTVLEPDTRCRLIVNAGIYTYDVNQTRGCAQAVVDILDQESLKQ